MTQVNDSIRSFFGTKSIQKTDQFLFSIDQTANLSLATNKNKRLGSMKIALDKRTGPQPVIENWHTRNFVLPNLNFQREIFPRGNFTKSFPSMKYEGFTFTVTLEDDSVGTIPNFVNWCQRRTVDESGFHMFESLNRIGNLRLDALDEFNEVIYKFVFEEAYYIEATPVSFDYSQSTQTLWTITFASDFVKFSGQK